MSTSIISIALAVALLWIAYRLLFINSNRLAFNRAFLIFVLGFALILPSLGILIGNISPSLANYKEGLFHGFMLDEIIITADGVTFNTVADTASTTQFNIWKYLGIIYIIGVGVMTLLFLLKLAKIAFVIIRSPKKKMPGYTAVFTGKEHGSYSFFN